MAVILITGARTGIGFHTAIACHAAGHTVYAGVRQKSHKLIPPELDKTCRLLELNICKASDIASALQTIRDEEGHLDVLINNAGINRLGAFEDMPEEDYRQVMETNFFGPWHMARAVLPMMRAQEYGQIIMISSLSALIGLPGDSAYAASKAALELASESLSSEVAPFGINVNILQPGAFATELMTKTEQYTQVNSDSPYAPLIEALRQNISPTKTPPTSERNDPNIVAEYITHLIETNDTSLRHLVGDQAIKVGHHIKSLNENDRPKLIRDVTDANWWFVGKAPSMTHK